MKGTLHCVCISRIKNLPPMEIKLFAVRKKMFLPEGWEHISTIAPSENLLREAKKKEKNGTWNEDSFRSFYEPLFRKEIMENEAAKTDLKRILESLQSGSDVAFACYCGNAKLCHRGIIGEIFEKLGYNVIYN